LFRWWFKSEYDKENNIISGTPLLVKDIQDISNLTSIQPWVTAGVNIFVLIYAISMASTICWKI
jgi:hypothetical protein